MTGEELQTLRISAGASDVELGRFLGWRGKELTLERNVRKLEKQDHIFPEVARNIRRFLDQARERAS